MLTSSRRIFFRPVELSRLIAIALLLPELSVKKLTSSYHAEQAAGQPAQFPRLAAAGRSRLIFLAQAGPLQRLAAVAVRGPPLRPLPRRLPPVHQLPRRPVPGPQLGQGVQPQVQVERPDARPHVAHLLLP